MKVSLTLLSLSLSVALVVGCAGRKSSASGPATRAAVERSAESSLEIELDPREKIEKKWQEIRQWQQPLPTIDAAATEPVPAAQPVPQSTSSSRPPSNRDTGRVVEAICGDESVDVESVHGCYDVCTLTDAICGNSESICRIAADLDGDPWADEKCTLARDACASARESCCDCLNP